MDVVGAFSQTVDQHVGRVGGRTDLWEMAQLAAAESLAAGAGADLPSLIGPTADDVKLAIGRLAARDRFASLARDFFARLTRPRTSPAPARGTDSRRRGAYGITEPA